MDEWLANWLAVVEQGMGLVPGPQLVEGRDDLIMQPGGGVPEVTVGRAYAAQTGVWTERWVMSDPKTARAAPALEIRALPADSTQDWLTSPLLAAGLTNPWFEDTDGFTYGPVPAAPGADPAGITAVGYKLYNVDAAGAKVQAGALYRMVEPGVGPAQDKRWVDHWVLWSGYTSPRVSPYVALRLEKQNPGWASLAAFFADGANVNKPSAQYALVELRWKVKP